MNASDAARMMGIASFPDGWTFHEVHRCGVLAGFFCTKGNEIHAFRVPEFRGRWLTRQSIERVIAPILAEFGEIKTAVRVENLTGHEFVTRLGFRPESQDDRNINYITKKVNHARL